MSEFNIHLSASLENFSNARYDTALHHFNIVLSLQPNNISVLHLRGITHLRLENNNLAFLDFNTILSHAPDDVFALTNRGMLHKLFGDYNSALVDFNRGLRLSPENAFLLQFRGNLYFLDNQLSLALNDFNELLRITPDHALALRRRGEIYRQHQNYDNALVDLNHSLHIDANNHEALLSKTQTLYAQQKYQEALVICNSLLSADSVSHTVYHLAGDIHFWLAQINDAQNNYRLALQASPNHLPSLFQLANCYYVCKQYQLAIDNFNLILKEDPRHFCALSNRSNSYAMLGQYEQAQADIETLLTITPDDIQLQYSLANICYTRALFERAITACTLIIQSQQDMCNAHLLRGKAYYRARKDNEAVTDFTYVITHTQDQSTHVAALVRRGLIYAQYHRDSEAINDFNKALEMDANNIQALAFRRDIYQKQNDSVKALADSTLILTLEPGNNNAQRIHYELTQICSDYSATSNGIHYTHKRSGSEISLDGSLYHPDSQRPQRGGVAYTRFFSNAANLQKKLVVKRPPYTYNRATEPELYRAEHERYHRECTIWNLFYPGNPAQLIQFENNHYRLVLPKLPGKMLDDVLVEDHYTKIDLLQIWFMIAQELERLHQLGWVHGDFKGDNALVHKLADNQWQVFLIDFGSSRMLGAQRRCLPPKERSECMQLANEFFNTRGAHIQVAYAQDVFSFATAMLASTENIPDPTDELPVLLRRAVSETPENRPSMQSLIECIQESIIFWQEFKEWCEPGTKCLAATSSLAHPR